MNDDLVTGIPEACLATPFPPNSSSVHPSRPPPCRLPRPGPTLPTLPPAAPETGAAGRATPSEGGTTRTRPSPCCIVLLYRGVCSCWRGFGLLRLFGRLAQAMPQAIGHPSHNALANRRAPSFRGRQTRAGASRVSSRRQKGEVIHRWPRASAHSAGRRPLVTPVSAPTRQPDRCVQGPAPYSVGTLSSVMGWSGLCPAQIETNRSWRDIMRCHSYKAAASSSGSPSTRHTG